MARKNLTDRFVKSKLKAPHGKRLEYLDANVPGLALRVTDTGHKSFVYIARYPYKPTHPTRRTIGEQGAITLEKARETARDWYDLIKEGKDPKIEAERRKAEAQRRQLNSFAAVAAEFIDRHARTLKKGREAESIIKEEFVKRWGARPITDIQPEEVAAAVRAIVKRGAKYQAHNAFGYIRRLFNWAIGTHEFGISASPVERLSPRDLIGKRDGRERILAEAELRLVWSATEAMGYPYGPLIRMLILTGQRLREVADMRWAEVDFDKRLWTVPAERMKGGRAHEVPLAPEAIALLGALPRFTGGGDFVFTTTGVRPVNGFSKAKTRLDRLAAGTADKLAPWVFHDLRRTMRTQLSALPVEDLVRELVIAHARPGLHKVYDQHSYRDEKRRCLELWERRLEGILNPAPASVTDIRSVRDHRAAATAQ